MSNFNVNLRELQLLLEMESERIRNSDFSDIKEIAERKVIALRALEHWSKREGLTRNEALALQNLKRLGSQNGILLKAVMNGVKYALARVDKIQTSDSSIGAYDRVGRGMHIEVLGIKNTIKL